MQIPWNRVAEILFSTNSSKLQFNCLQILVSIAKYTLLSGNLQQLPGLEKLLSGLISNILTRFIRPKNVQYVVKSVAIQFIGTCCLRDSFCMEVVKQPGVFEEIMNCLNNVKESADSTVRILEAINNICSWSNRSTYIKQFSLNFFVKLIAYVSSKQMNEILFLSACSLRHLLSNQEVQISLFDSLIESIKGCDDSKLLSVFVALLELVLFSCKIVNIPEHLKDPELARIYYLEKIIGCIGLNSWKSSILLDVIRRLLELEETAKEKMYDGDASSVSAVNRLISSIVDKCTALLAYDSRTQKLIRYICVDRANAVEFLIPDLILTLTSQLSFILYNNRVLREVYQFTRMDLNISMMSNIYDSLDSLFSYISSSSEFQKMLESLNISFVFHITTFISSIKSFDKWVTPWQDLLLKIRKAYTQYLSRTSELVVQHIDSYIAEYSARSPRLLSPMSSGNFGSIQANGNAGIIHNAFLFSFPSRLMFVYKNNIEIVPLSSKISYDELISGIRQKYGRDLIPRFNYRGSLITIDSQIVLDRAVSILNSDALRLELYEHQNFSAEMNTPQSLQNDGFIAYLGKRYKVDINVLKGLRTEWLTVTPNNYMTRDLFMLTLSGPTSSTYDAGFAELLFSGMDASKSGGINFEAWVKAISMLKNNNSQARLEFVFHALDADGDGLLSLRDLEQSVLMLQNYNSSANARQFIE
jgi:hypothetical protein